jgi:hypothetical protein
MKLINTLIIISIIAFYSCSTPYQPKGSLGGYSEEKITSNMYKVKFRGNQHTKIETVQNYLLYRCAELTKEKGFNYFTVITEEHHFDEHSMRPERGASFETRTSESGGTITSVKPDLQNPTSSTNYTAVFFIRLLSEIDEKYKNAVFNVDEVFEELSDTMK